MTTRKIVAIDGPAGSGKTTLLRGLCHFYRSRGYPTLAISSGELYRAIAFLAALRLDGQQPSGPACLQLAQLECLELRGSAVCLGNEELEPACLHSPTVSRLAPVVAQFHQVRDWVNQMIRETAEAFLGLVLVDGRDAGSLLFPNAHLKLYLTVGEGEAATRQGTPLADLQRRNRMDSKREIAPLQAAPDAVTLDTSGRSIQEILEAAVQLVGEHLPELGRLHLTSPCQAQGLF